MGQSENEYNLHAKAKLLKANKCLYDIRTRRERREGARREEINQLFTSFVIPNFTCGFLVYDAYDLD